MRQWTLYVLKLEQNKYYVGITTKSAEDRFQEHVNNIRSAAWVRRFKPLKIIDQRALAEITEEKAKNYETEVTLEYMRKYGINNVRGGDYAEQDDYVIEGRNFFKRDVWELKNRALWIVTFLIILLSISICFNVYLLKQM